VCGLRICGRRSAVIIVNWIRGLTATVRSAITATAELLVFCPAGVDECGWQQDERKWTNGHDVRYSLNKPKHRSEVDVY